MANIQWLSASHISNAKIRKLKMAWPIKSMANGGYGINVSSIMEKSMSIMKAGNIGWRNGAA